MGVRILQSRVVAFLPLWMEEQHACKYDSYEQKKKTLHVLILLVSWPLCSAHQRWGQWEGNGVGRGRQGSGPGGQGGQGRDQGEMEEN